MSSFSKTRPKKYRAALSRNDAGQNNISMGTSRNDTTTNSVLDTLNPNTFGLNTRN